MKKNKAFTLVEMMVTMAIVAIMAVVAVPGFQDYQKKNEFNTAVSQIEALINQAAVMAKNPEKDASSYIIEINGNTIKLYMYKNSVLTEVKSVGIATGISLSNPSGSRYLIFNRASDYVCNTAASTEACTITGAANSIDYLNIQNSGMNLSKTFNISSSLVRVTVQ